MEWRRNAFRPSVARWPFGHLEAKCEPLESCHPLPPETPQGHRESFRLEVLHTTSREDCPGPSYATLLSRCQLRLVLAALHMSTRRCRGRRSQFGFAMES